MPAHAFLRFSSHFSIAPAIQLGIAPNAAASRRKPGHHFVAFSNVTRGASKSNTVKGVLVGLPDYSNIFCVFHLPVEVAVNAVWIGLPDLFQTRDLRDHRTFALWRRLR